MAILLSRQGESPESKRCCWPTARHQGSDKVSCKLKHFNAIFLECVCFAFRGVSRPICSSDDFLGIVQELLRASTGFLEALACVLRDGQNSNFRLREFLS